MEIYNWEKFIEIDPKFYRPAEVDVLRGHSGKARAVLGWSPKTSFSNMVKIMIDNDIKLLKTNE